jgi:hypothetical protein
VNIAGLLKGTLRGGGFVLCAILLAGCIDSAEPILTDAKPVFGPRFKAQLFTLGDGVAKDPTQEQFTWDGKRYVSTSAKPTIEPFTAFPFGAGDFIVQSVTVKPPVKAEYALLHKLVDGVFIGRVVDEDDADEQTRAASCKKTDKYTCRVETREQLLALVRATAAKHHQSGGLVVMVDDTRAVK